jgi:hypothetical protein
MRSRALLIGSALDSLGGVENDLAAMEKALVPRGFAVERCTGQDATRAGILAAYARLIEATEAGDAAVVYYSGHGGFAAAPDPETPGPQLWDLQFLAPADYHDSTAGDFRGISSIELSVLLARLTARTDNATVVLDCCHAAHMSRDADHGVRVRALPKRTPYQGLRDHIERLRASGELDTGLLSATGNPKAVRIVACAPEQSAYEYEGVDGKQTGILTESLALALAEAGTQRVSWATVLDRVRRRVLAVLPYQRPEVEGPARRILFETAEDDVLTAPAVTELADGRARIECAALLGVRRGDTFTLFLPSAPTGSDGEDDGTGTVGTLEVAELDAFAAYGQVEFSNGQKRIAPGTRARRRTATASTLPVLLPEHDQRVAALRKAVEDSPLLHVAGVDDVWQAAVRVDENGALTLADRVGPLGAARKPDPGAPNAVCRDLEVLARATALRALTGDATWALNAAVTIGWGTIREGARCPLARSHATAHVDDHTYVSVRNDSRADVYVSMIDIGVGGGITVLTRDSPSGVRLAQGKEYALGFNGYTGALVGVPLVWPRGLDPDAARPETVLVLVSSAPQDVSALEQHGVGGKDGPRSPLAALIAQISVGGVRDLVVPAGPDGRYDVHVIDFELDPVPQEGGFLIDERPSRATLLQTPLPNVPTLASRSAPEPTTTVAIRLEELVVHRNRGWMGTDVRVDTIVLTGEHGRPADFAYHARTEHFPRVRSGQSLPLDRMLLYYGPAVDYLDLAIWLSRDDAGGPGLGELLAQETSGYEMQEALARLTDSFGALPGVAVAATALGLAAVVVNAAYKLLRGQVGEVIGLYRGSMLANEGFGVGRHPEVETRPVRDFSLAYRIEEI